jgi:hypothetical protein
MEPGKGRLRLIRGSLELSDGPLRTAAILYLHKLVSCTPASRPPLRYINRLLSVESRCDALAVGRTYLFPPISLGGASLARPWLYFHTPLIEPDWRISRIRLSDTTSRLHPPHVVRIFANGESCLRLVRAVAVETHENWLKEHRYLNMDDLREHKREALRRAA